jgi:hypothetical protein
MINDYEEEHKKGRACSGEKGNVYRALVGEPSGNRPLARPTCRWDNIKMDLREIG